MTTKERTIGGMENALDEPKDLPELQQIACHLQQTADFALSTLSMIEAANHRMFGPQPETEALLSNEVIADGGQIADLWGQAHYLRGLVERIRDDASRICGVV